MLLVQTIAFAQPNPIYKSIDNYAVKINDTNLLRLTRKLVTQYNNDSAKVRSIFRWMTAHIGYDVKTYHRTEPGYPELKDFKGSSDTSIFEKEYSTAVAQMVFRKRVGICDGYSRLFKEMCTIAGISCETVTGGSRDFNDRIIGGYNVTDRHAWNAVSINNQWQLVDVTWASGYADEQVTRFTRKLDENYYLAPPERFAFNHFPADKKWYLFDEQKRLKQPIPAPYRFPELWNRKIISYYPGKGIIFVRKNGVIEFKLEAMDSLQSVYFSGDGDDEIHFDIVTLPKEIRQPKREAPVSSVATKAKVSHKKVTPDPYIDAIFAFVESGDTSLNQPTIPYVADSLEAMARKTAPTYKVDGKNVTISYPFNNSPATTLFITYNDEYILKYELMVLAE